MVWSRPLPLACLPSLFIQKVGSPGKPTLICFGWNAKLMWAENQLFAPISGRGQRDPQGPARIIWRSEIRLNGTQYWITEPIGRVSSTIGSTTETRSSRDPARKPYCASY
ncbi:hypothetical protein BCV70DRAFT_200662 [Testicularia cyperi]|uniref:Uncharacterized protein n=1 Tax=Testicularia cyperi TaxID=1882483 RepID=A0A317XQX6_9BASI|nr:hypothetical protein BCV70DRAFT_200662 [Testicularia cyperi]